MGSGAADSSTASSQCNPSLSQLNPNSTRSRTSQRASDALPASEIHYMTVNGGPCLLRMGLWSQTPADVKVYLPLPAISLHLAVSPGQSSIEKREWKVDFSLDAVQITHIASGTLQSEPLEYYIKPRECFWMIESVRTKSLEQQQFLVLHMSKSEPLERFPG